MAKAPIGATKRNPFALVWEDMLQLAKWATAGFNRHHERLSELERRVAELEGRPQQ
jgi:hypothetical protein